jgi:Spy/CpxP family protein refolding chaperone
VKTKKTNLQYLLLTAALALPLATLATNVPAPAPEQGQRGDGPGPDGSHPRGAPYGPPPGGPGMMHREPHFLHGLDLSEAQQDKVFTILHGQEPYLREQGKALRKAQEALHALGRADKYDDAQAGSLAQAAAQAMSNLELQRVRTEQKLLAVLTPEQRKQLDQRMAGAPHQPSHP